MGSPIWKMWYSFPQTTEEMVEKGYAEIKELWSPIFDVFDCRSTLGIKFSPSNVAFDDALKTD